MGRIASPLTLTSLKILKITYKAPYESTFTAVALPTTEPATPQVRYTVAEADLPTLNMTVESKVIAALMYAAGYNAISSPVTLYWRMLKNGASVAVGSALVDASYSWTLNAYFYNVAVGDVLDIKLWASASGLYHRYKAWQMQLTRVKLLAALPLVPFTVASLSNQPTLTQLYPYVKDTKWVTSVHESGASLAYSTAKTFNWWKQADLFRIGYGDLISNKADVNTFYSETVVYEPYYNRNVVPTEIRVRGLKL